MIYADGHKLIDDSDWINTSANVNLLSNSKSLEIPNADISKNKILNEKYQCGQILEFDDTGLDNSGFQIGGLPANTIISWSFYAKSEDSTIHTEFFGGKGATEFKVNSFWTRYSFTTTTGTQGTLFIWRASGTKPLYLALPKVEAGSITTQWSPAPQELVTQSDLDDLKTQIEQLKSK